MKQYFSVVEIMNGRITKVFAPYPTKEMARKDAIDLAEKNKNEKNKHKSPSYIVKITTLPDNFW